ncbi:hypothetical protein KM92DES2_12648 [uncultured Desulfovibrio sp.]|uniref:Uncharacterized protein n=1 Tax=uncultured Desulfovibrio sp. TaxID=167968 RepID=A0A212KC02_9BACT|nr:hypothetical protein KM92DES2_12648 [uncultured Desulfovibrio sp.]
MPIRLVLTDQTHKHLAATTSDKVFFMEAQAITPIRDRLSLNFTALFSCASPLQRV